MAGPDSSLLTRVVGLAAATGAEAEVIETFSGAPLVTVRQGTADDVAAAFDRARHAQPSWAARPIAERVRVLRRLADLVHAELDQVMDVIQAETGKARFGALEEALDLMLVARFYASRGAGWLASRRVQGLFPVLTKAVVHHHPIGVVGVISPWNFPLTLSIGDAVPALLAGNAVVLKPDSKTPLSALLGAELLRRAGLPQDVLTIVPGSGRVVGAAIADAADYLMFTGSVATGRVLAARAGERLIGFSAELGGKNPMIVGAGADLGRVVEIATRALYSNAGQLCISIERIYVEASIADEFTARLTKRVAALRVGPGYDYGRDVGSLISAEQVQTVAAHVQDAVANGARVLTGGRARPDLGPCFFEPTLLADVPPNAICFGEETFGPLASIYPVGSLDEAVTVANDSPFGLNASVFAASRREGEAIARQLRTGTVNVDEGYAVAWGSHGGPMGGQGISGVGRRHGSEGLLKYTEAQTVATQRLVHLGGPGLPPETWYPLLGKAANLLKYLPGR